MTKSIPKPLIAVGLAVLALLAYSSAIQGGFIWDDESYVERNEFLRSTEGLGRIWTDLAPVVGRADELAPGIGSIAPPPGIEVPGGGPGALVTFTPQYYPLVFTTFWVEWHLWGDDAMGYHVVNVLIHLGSALLLWGLLARLRVPGALFAAAVFLLHPVHVESVAWITERKNVLSMFFMLAAALAYLRFRPVRAEGVGAEDEEPAPGRPAWYALALALFLCALLSKTVTACLPAAILLVVWWKRGGIGWRDVLPLVPMFLFGGLLGMNTSYLEQTRVGAEGPEWDFTLAEKCLIAGRAPWFYLGKLVVPYPLAFFYTRWDPDPGEWWQLLFPAAAVLLVVALLVLRKRIGRGPLAATLFFGGALLPASGLFALFPQRYSFVADHFQYHASLGPIVLLAAIGATVFASARRRRAGIAAAAVVLVVLGGLTWSRGRVYESLQTLWEDTVDKTPTCWGALLPLSRIYFEQGRKQEAYALGERALEHGPDIVEVHQLVGNLRAERGDIDGALELFGRHLRNRPAFEQIAVSSAMHLCDTGRKADGIRLLEGVEEILPRSLLAKYQLGLRYAQERRLADAKTKLLEVVGMDARHAEAHYNLGLLFAQGSDWRQAAYYFQRALEIQPDLPRLRERLQRALQELQKLQKEG